MNKIEALKYAGFASDETTVHLIEVMNARDDAFCRSLSFDEVVELCGLEPSVEIGDLNLFLDSIGGCTLRHALTNLMIWLGSYFDDKETARFLFRKAIRGLFWSLSPEVEVCEGCGLEIEETEYCVVDDSGYEQIPIDEMMLVNSLTRIVEYFKDRLVREEHKSIVKMFCDIFMHVYEEVFGVHIDAMNLYIKQDLTGDYDTQAGIHR